MSEKVAEHADGGGLSNVSINKTLTLLRQVLSAGVRYGYLDRNPVDGVRRLKVEKKSQAFLQLDQIDALLDATPEKDQPFLWTLLLSGLRIGEALALRWGDLEALAKPPRLNIARTWDPASKRECAERRGIEGPVKTGRRGASPSGTSCSRPFSTTRHARPSRASRLPDLEGGAPESLELSAAGPRQGA